MEIIAALVTKELKELNINNLKEQLNGHLERVYYKLALINKLKEEKLVIILHEKIEENITNEEIVEIMKMASNKSILIINEEHRNCSFLNYLLEQGIYNGIFENEVNNITIINLLENSRDYNEASNYYLGGNRERSNIITKFLNKIKFTVKNIK